jgi:hypothetical protein
LIRFYPEVEQLHLYSMRERTTEQTKRAAKHTASAVKEFVGGGLAMAAHSYFTPPPELSNSSNCEKSVVSIAVNSAMSTPYNQLCRLKNVILRTLTECRPVIWILDDLQYANKDGLSTLSFIQFILEDWEMKQFLFVGLSVTITKLKRKSRLN